MAYKLIWSEEAVSNLESILNYLGSNWSETEVQNFKSLLNKNLELISIFPTIFPKSEFAPNLRRAVLSKHNSIFYQILNEAIYISYLFDNRQNIERLK
jgi:plasmid stabilization system protein ParE